MSQDDDEASVFARNWIVANINPGPHSVNDGRIEQGVVDQFLADADEAGVSEEQLERSLGPARAFLQAAFDDARRAWKSELRS